MKIFGEGTANRSVREHNDTNRNTGEVSQSTDFMPRVRKAGKRAVALAVAPVAAISISACGDNKGSGYMGAEGSSGETLYASSCASEYKSDGTARIYDLLGNYDTFEERIDNGTILDTDDETPVRQFTDRQRAQLITSYAHINEDYKPKAAPVNNPTGLSKLNIVVYGDPESSTSPGAQDGKLTGNVCVTFGDRATWSNIRRGGTEGGSYEDGDVPPALRP